MSKASPAMTNFNAGELSPLLDARIDFEKYPNGASLLENFIPTVQGPIKKRGGTKFVAKTENGSKVLLLPFEFSTQQTYVVEMGERYARFYTSDSETGERGLLIKAGGSPVKVGTPYSLNDLFNPDGSTKVRYAQSGDVLYICCPGHPVHLLKRVSAVDFRFERFQHKNGPFEDINDTNTQVTVHGDRWGGVTVEANGSIFTQKHVGSLFYVEASETHHIKPWEPASFANIKMEERSSDGKNYTAQNNAVTGYVKPIHNQGIEWDGKEGFTTVPGVSVPVMSGVKWLYTDSGYGHLRIDWVSGDGRQAGGHVLSGALPTGVMGRWTKRWAHGAWSQQKGYPTSVAFFRSRLWFARGQQLWASVSDNFGDYAAKNFSEVTPDMAISITLASGRINDIQWLQPDKKLIAGTSAGEFAIGELTNGSAIGPNNVSAVLQSEYGSKPIQPVKNGGATLFMQRAGLKARELFYSMAADGYSANDVSVLAEHITVGAGLKIKNRPLFGIAAMSVAKEPDPIVWMVRTDGALIGFTWDNEQDVKGWHRHDVSGAVTSIATLPSFEGDREELWLCVKRTINEQEHHYVEYMEKEYKTGENEAEQYYVDCGLTYRGEAGEYKAREKVSRIHGLEHLEGCEVSILADGAVQPNKTVKDGQINLDLPASIVHVGLPFKAKYRSMRLEAGAADGTAQGKTKRINRVVFRLNQSGECDFGRSFDRMDSFNFRKPTDRMGVAVPLFSGDVNEIFPDTYTSEGRIALMSNKPLALTVVGIFPQVQTQDR